jgi:hypothetical protein
VVEHRLAKARVAGSNPVSRSNCFNCFRAPLSWRCSATPGFTPDSSLQEAFNRLPQMCWGEMRIAVEHARGFPAAERQLVSSLKGEFEGFVDRFFNPKLSRWFTRVFLALGLSPNAITMVATVIGLVAAAGFGLGSYSAGIAAALLFQLATVIERSDGEVARLTFTESPFGAWLDIAMDNEVHMAIFGGIAVGAFIQGAGTEQAWVPLALGAAAIRGNALSFTLVNKAQKN